MKNLAEVLAADDLNISGPNHQIHSTATIVAEILDGQKKDTPIRNPFYYRLDDVEYI
jgi:hypothetical protein